MRSRLSVFICAISIGVLASVAARPARAQEAALETLLGRAARYTLNFVDRFSNVVAEERYIQRTSASTGPRRRIVLSDFLLVRSSETTDYLPFRDVFEVDGVRVRDREQRLEKLFLKPSPGMLERAAAIADESSRYNLGSERLRRTINNPVMALSFLQPATQPRFQFVLDRKEPEGWVVRFTEQQRPSLIRGAFDANILARGRVWIDFATGRVQKTELLVDDASVNADITTTFRFDDRFGIAVPVMMTDHYLIGVARLQLDGEATYGRFRRFGVTTDQTLQSPKP
jgi:hypothetical protein